MRNWILHIIYIGIWAAFAVSCSSVLEDEIPNIDYPTGKDERVNLTFTLVLGEQSSASRAAWSEDDENLVGSVAENAINSLQVLLFSEDGNICYGPLEQTEFFPINQEKSIYEFTGSIPLNAENACIKKDILNCKIMVLANSQVQIANDATAQQIKDALEACEYTYSTLDPNPMWGVSTISNQPVIKGWGIELDPIYVLRSLAKIEVDLSQSLKDAGYTLDAVTLTKHNTKGYCLPSGYYTTINGQTTIAEKTEDLDQEGVLHAYSSVTTKALGFTGSSNNGYIVYVPEYEMQGSEEDPTLRLTLKKGTETILIGEADPVLYFKNYDKTTGKPTDEIFNIVRNHWYQYSITGVSNGLDLTLAVVPWVPNDDVLDYTENTVRYSVGTWSDNIQYDEKDPTIVLLETGVNVAPASYQFTLQTPKNAEWRAVLEGEQIRFHTGAGFSGEILGDDDTSKTIHGFTSSDNSGVNITLGVKAEDSNMSGQFSARLRFYVNLNNKWYEIDLVDGNESTTGGDGLNHWTIKHLKSSLG